jgi:uncharacterized protein YbbK (DUF523 family)
LAPPTLVSACLLGAACRYDGQSKAAPLSIAGAIIPVCPEVMAGLGVPRPAIERGIDGRVRVLATGLDITAELTTASDRIVAIAKRHGARRAILKERSPSCGSSQLRRGSDIVAGEGLLTERLRSSGIIVESELR